MFQPRPKLAIVGPSSCGKDEMAKFLSQPHYGWRYTLSTSQVIAPFIAAEDGCSVAEAFARRHAERDRWRAKGDELRAHDPAYLARRTLEHGDLCVGVRSLVEIEAVRREGLVDLIVWVERDVPPDETLEYDSSLADIVVENRWDLAAFHERLDRLARTWGLVPRAERLRCLHRDSARGPSPSGDGGIAASGY